MRRLLFIYIIILPRCLWAYAVSGIVTDHADGTAIAGVTILNASNGASAIADARGYFTIPAETGDHLTLTAIGYERADLTVGTASFYSIKMKQKNVQLKEFVLSDLTPFQKDSVAMHKLYQDQLDKKPPKIQYAGLSASGLISAFAYSVSRKSRQNKAFKKNFNNDEQQKFVSTRYTPSLTGRLTGLTGDTLAYFMNAYPMDYTFARTATDLELKMWIRDNYKRYKKDGLVFNIPMPDTVIVDTAGKER